MTRSNPPSDGCVGGETLDAAPRHDRGRDRRSRGLRATFAFLLLGACLVAHAGAQFAGPFSMAGNSTAYVIDLTGDGVPEIVCSNGVSPFNGSLVVSTPTQNGWAILGIIGLTVPATVIAVDGGEAVRRSRW